MGESESGPAVVVTGAGQGIGRALATRLAAAGAQVVVNDLDPVTVAKTGKDIGAYAIAGDMSTASGVASVVEQARDHLGKIDIWFGNAGVDLGRGLETSDEDWQASWDINTMAHVRAARLLVPGWLERGAGRMVITASAAGLLTMLDAPAYSVTKHGVVAFAEWLSATYRHRGIIVQLVCPQGVKTEMLDNSGDLQELLSHDRALDAAEVAETIWQALSDDRLLVLPHPQVAGYYEQRATRPDRWLEAMNRLQQRIDGAAAPKIDRAAD